MNTTTLIAILASTLIPARRHDPPPVESYEWVAGEVRADEPGWCPRVRDLLHDGPRA